MPKSPVESRFWSKVRKTSTCWLWTACVDDSGYGEIGIEGNKKLKAHRLSYLLSGKSIPEGFCVLHTCDNPPCVRIDHLYVGTKLQNARDRKSRGRNGDISGEKHPNAKLSADDITQLRVRGKDGKSFSQMAKAYGVSKGHIQNIIHGRVWKSAEVSRG